MADERLKFTITAIDRTAAAFRSIKNRLGGIRTAIAGLAIGAVFKKLSSDIDQLAKDSGKLGISVQSLRELQFAADQSGVSAETLGKGLERFSRSISETALGMGTAKRSFEDLGISVKNTDGSLKTSEQVLAEVADKLQGVGSDADKVRIAFDLFGRSGTALLNTLADGSKGIADAREEFKALTFELSPEKVAAVEAANDQFSKIGDFLKSAGQAITAILIPALARMTTFIVIVALKAVRTLVSGFRTVINSVIDFGNAAGKFLGFKDKFEKIKFGEDFEKQITEAMQALAKYGQVQKNVAKTDDPLKVDIYGNAVGVYEKVKETVKASLTPLQQYQEATAKIFDQVQNTGVQAMQNLEDSLLGVIRGTMSAKDAFKNMANSIIDDILRMQIRKSITGPLSGFLDQAITGFLDPTPGPGLQAFDWLANGGTVSTGKPYIVGEKGPELFMPGVTGRVVPNHSMGSQGSSVIVNQTLNIETGVSQTVRAEIAQLMPTIAENTKAAVLDARRRGGSFASAFGG